MLIIIVRGRRKEKYPAIRMIIPRRGGRRGKVGTLKVSQRTSYSLFLEWNNKGAALTLKGKLHLFCHYSLMAFICALARIRSPHHAQVLGKHSHCSHQIDPG